MWQETTNYYVYVIEIIKGVLKVIDHLKIRLLHHITSYFWWGDRNRTITKGGGELKENSKQNILNI